MSNVFNSLWYTQVSWPDYDMWMTDGGHADYYAVEHAISAGPIYTSDHPGKEKWKWLWPLIFADGKVIRPDSPALPIQKLLLKNPYLDLVPLAAFAPVRDTGMLAVWNMDNISRGQGRLSPSDVQGIKGEKFAVYEQFSKKLMVLDRNATFPVRLSGWKVQLYSVVPVKNGFAPIGLINKYVSPATVIATKVEPGRAMVTLAEMGAFAAYCEHKPAQIKLNGSTISAQLYTYDSALLTVNIAGPTDRHPKMELEISW